MCLHYFNNASILLEYADLKDVEGNEIFLPVILRRLFWSKSLVLFRRLMWQKEFDTTYTGFMKDGAQWLVDNTDIKLVGKH